MTADRSSFDEERLGKSYDVKLIRRIVPYMKPYSGVFVGCVMILGLISLLDLAVPYVTKEAIDRYIIPVQGEKNAGGDRMITVDVKDETTRAIIDGHRGMFRAVPDGKMAISLDHYETLSRMEKTGLRKKDLMGLSWAAGLILLMVVLNFVLTFFQKLVMEYAGQMIMHDLRMEVFRHIQSLSLTFFNRNPVGRLVTRATNDIQNMQEMFGSVIDFVFKDVFLIVGIAGILFYTSPRLALTSFTVLPFVLLAAVYFARYAREVFREMRTLVARINTRFSESIQGMKVIQLFRYERENHRTFAELNHENYVMGIRQLHIFAVFMPVVELLGSISLALIIYFGGKDSMAGTVSLGTLVAFISYMKMFFRPIRDVAEKYNILQNSLSSAERIFLILDNTGDREDETDESDAKPHLGPIRRIDFEGVGFGYNTQEQVLTDVSFDIGEGETLAIVGPTGAGKTTLINLLIRFHDPVTGIVRLNSRDARDFSLKEVRSRIALVTQDPFLFSGSIRQNILGDTLTMGEDAFREVLEASHCATFVDRLPEGAETLLFEGGATLSSGERQLISIARALAKNPDVIVLDEATSYIDTESEVKIQEALTRLMTSRTSVIIAHRISTARHADRIVVLKKGKVVEVGNHRTLMENKGLYYSLNQIKG